MSLPKVADEETIKANERLREHQKNQETKLVSGNDGEKIALNQGFTRKATVFLKGNNNCEFNVDKPCTKVLIEDCNNCTIRLNGRINTECVEFWNCENSSLLIKTKVKTLQADLSKNAKIEYEEKSQFSQLVWAGMSNFTLVIGGETLETGVEKVDREEIPDYKEDFDQFIVRYIKGKLKEELIVRLKNGFPTTEREAAEFDEQKEKNDALYEAHVRKLISSRAVGDKLEQLTKTEVKKVGRNDPCSCGSGKKFKKCCEGKSVLESEEAKKQIEEAKEAIKEAEEQDKKKKEEVQKIASGMTKTE
mmetsp:Transcript_21916/g.37417  ORF Transcript_21916/g.37417 Transcript_21916/m.37417 type:complete len:305 (-) Transcript_21916:23-937(-)